MTDLALDPITRDLVITSGSPIAINGPAEVAQAIGIRLRCFLGEWFLDTTHGVPYLERVLGKVPRPELVEAVLRAQVLSVAGVTGLEAFELRIDPRTRVAQVTFIATTKAGVARGQLSLGAAPAAPPPRPADTEATLDNVILGISTLA